MNGHCFFDTVNLATTQAGVPDLRTAFRSQPFFSHAGVQN
jgi:hypothetical protein